MTPIAIACAINGSVPCKNNPAAPTMVVSGL